MDVSIVILNYKNKGLIRQQLRHLFSHPVSQQLEVLVVDNNSGDGIENMLIAEFPNVQYIQTGRNGGYAAGNNAGIDKAVGRYVLVLNPDVVITPSQIAALYEFMEQHPKVGVAGPKLTNADGTLQPSCLRFPNIWLPLFRRTFLSNTSWGRKWLANYFMEDWDHTKPMDVDWLFGACLMVRREALAQVGPLDERFFLYLEDTDWCRRFWEKGWQVYYVPTVSVIHLLNRSSEGPIAAVVFNKTARIHLISFVKYLRKYRGKANPHMNEHHSITS